MYKKWKQVLSPSIKNKDLHGLMLKKRLDFFMVYYVYTKTFSIMYNTRRSQHSYVWLFIGFSAYIYISSTKFLFYQIIGAWYKPEKKNIAISFIKLYLIFYCLLFDIFTLAKNDWGGWFWAGNQSNHQNWIPFILPYKFWLISVGMK